MERVLEEESTTVVRSANEQGLQQRSRVGQKYKSSLVFGHGSTDQRIYSFLIYCTYLIRFLWEKEASKVQQ